jgi:hypothetical protein
VSATSARTGRSVLIGMANAPKVGCYMCAWRKCPPTAPLLPRFYAGFRHVQLRAVEKSLTDILRSIKMNFDGRPICTLLLRPPGRLRVLNR